jgi:hypothetical protein
LNVLDHIARYPFCDEKKNDIDASSEVLHDYYQAIYDEFTQLGAPTTFWTTGLPDFLKHKLNPRQRERQSPIIVIGTPPSDALEGTPLQSAAPASAQGAQLPDK